jgi:small subunit ribosomal protein S6
MYETAFIVNAGLDDPQIDAVVEKVKETIAKHGGAVKDVDLWGRKRFAYPIKKKNNGYYAILGFEGPGDLVAKLERHYQLDENILRYLTIVLDKHALATRDKRSAEKAAEAAAAAAGERKEVVA